METRTEGGEVEKKGGTCSSAVRPWAGHLLQSRPAPRISGGAQGQGFRGGWNWEESPSGCGVQREALKNSEINLCSQKKDIMPFTPLSNAPFESINAKLGENNTRDCKLSGAETGFWQVLAEWNSFEWNSRCYSLKKNNKNAVDTLPSHTTWAVESMWLLGLSFK